MNKVIIVGRLTRDAELKTVGEEERIVMNFTMAVDKPYRPDIGQKEAEFIPVSYWGKSAQNLCEYMLKGKLISVGGHIHVRNHEDSEGKRRYSMGIIAEEIRLLEGKKEQNSEAENVQ